MMKEKKLRKITWIIIMSVISFVMIFPLLMMLSTSLKSNGELLKLIPSKLEFSNYKEVLMQGDWATYFKNSLIIAFLAVAISLFLNALAGYVFSRLRFPGKKILFAFILVGLMLPEQLTLLPTFLLLSHFPLFGGNDILGQGGTGLYNTYAGILLPLIAGPFGIYFCKQFFDGFPEELDDAALIDGASRWKAFIHIYIPNAKPMFATLGLLKFVSTWNNYLWPLIMTNSESMKTVQLALTRFQQEDKIQWNMLMAGTTLVAIPVVIVFLICQKQFIQSNLNAGMK